MMDPKLPPHDDTLEEALLGGPLVPGADSQLMNQMVEAGVEEDWFYTPANREVWAAMRSLYDESAPVDLLSVPRRLDERRKLEAAGGLERVSALADKFPGSIDWVLPELRDLWVRRRIIVASSNAVTTAKDMALKVPDLCDRMEKEWLRINVERSQSKEVAIADAVNEAMQAMDEYNRGGAQLLGISTGYAYLDKMLCGFQPEQLIVLAARPGMGKTSLGMQFVESAAVDAKHPTVVFSLEMSGRSLVERMVFQRARADYQRYRTGFMEAKDFAPLVKSAASIRQGKLWIDATSALSVTDLKARTRRLVAARGVKFIMVDYMQLMKGGAARYMSRTDEVTEISGALKALAKELKIPVLALAQLNRDAERDRHGKAPQLADLRESGSIEQDADVVMFIWEPKLDDQKTLETERVLRAQGMLTEVGQDWSKSFTRRNLFVAKQRNGPTGNVEMVFRKSCMRFDAFTRSVLHDQEHVEDL